MIAPRPLVAQHIAAVAPQFRRDAARAAVGSGRFGLVARGTVTTGAGSHTLTVTSDDGVRVLVDGEVVSEMSREMGSHNDWWEALKVTWGEEVDVEVLDEYFNDAPNGCP